MDKKELKRLELEREELERAREKLEVEREQLEQERERMEGERERMEEEREEHGKDAREIAEKRRERVVIKHGQLSEEQQDKLDRMQAKLDAAQDKMDNAQYKIEIAMDGLDEKIENSIAGIDFDKINETVEKAMANIDMDKINKEVEMHMDHNFTKNVGILNLRDITAEELEEMGPIKNTGVIIVPEELMSKVSAKIIKNIGTVVPYKKGWRIYSGHTEINQAMLEALDGDLEFLQTGHLEISNDVSADMIKKKVKAFHNYGHVQATEETYGVLMAKCLENYGSITKNGIDEED